ncbi:hypothetical protein CR513_49419, partial [Mucuna pruriens]
MERHHYHYYVSRSRLNQQRQHYHYYVSRSGLNQQRQHYQYYVSGSRLNQHTTLIPGLTTLLHYPCVSIPYHDFFQNGQNFLGTLLSGTRLSVQSMSEIVEGVLYDIRQLFQVEVVASPSSNSQRDIPLWLEINLFDNGIHAAMEESMQCFKMTPASNEAIQTSLKKSTVITQSENCPICLEELNVFPN